MNSDDILKVITQVTREVLPGLDDHEFVRSDRLAELGANSLDRADIIVRVLETLGLSIPRTALARATNVGELADLLQEASSAH
jgi:polyketide biosynthesis acyl carrier protein